MGRPTHSTADPTPNVTVADGDADAMTGNLFRTLAVAHAGASDRPFLRLPRGPALGYGDVDLRSAEFAGALRELGVAPGDRVVVQVEKSTDAVALYLACLRVGAVLLPLNTAYTVGEVGYFVDDAGPSLIVGRPGTIDALAAVASAVGVPAETLGVDGDGSLAVRADAATPFDDVVDRRDDDVAAMLYTSGTTGRSKGAMLTHENLRSNAIALHDIWNFDADDILLHTLPIFHVHGLFVALHCAMLSAAEVVFLPRFDVGDVIAHLPESTVMMGVPTQYSRLLADDRFDETVCTNIRLFTSGSAPMTEAVHREFTDRSGHRILERYGMTEAGMITSNPYAGERVPGTVGFALPGVEMRVADDEGREVAAGETGTVEIRSPGLFAGYWQMPEKTASEHRDGGWFITGDVGSVDGEGRLTLEGRVSDMIISGGYNVYPKEIELVLDEVPGVAESAVVGVPHPDFGEAVVAVIVPDTDLSILPTRDRVDREAELVGAMNEALAGALARFKHPKAFRFVDALPRNAMSKVQKAELRTRFDDQFTIPSP